MRLPTASLFCLIVTLTVSFPVKAGDHLFNRAPLAPKAYSELPIGSIKARGWVLEMLERQRAGATGYMDVLYPEVMGPRNGWLGGDGDQWERGPYWIDGLLPLAYLMDDDDLKAKVSPWIEWMLGSQTQDGFFGPAEDYGPEPGLQRHMAEDWWPRMVVLKILQQHYSATGDVRVVDFMTRYFRYQLETLPAKPLDKWSHWALFRVCDNLQAVYWLYNMTGEAFLLELADLLYSQGHDFTNMFLNTDAMTRFNSIHCVNLAQGIKQPIIYYQQHPEQKYIDAVKKGFADIRKFNGQPQGMYGGDEGLHGMNPTQGTELCAIVEMMYSLEKMIEITGDVAFADHLERVAFNALPTQVSDDFMYKQYLQQPNQVMCTRHVHNFYEDASHAGTDVIYGTLSGFPCCFSNMHQGWPKFTQHLWYAAPDNGVAAMVYSPSEVTLNLGGGSEVTITEETLYPMDDEIRFTVVMAKKKSAETFPFHLRIPSWCKNAEIRLNGEVIETPAAGTVAVLDRTWRNGDRLVLKLPMEVSTSRWYENSIAVERGPLVYGLKMEENWEPRRFKDPENAQFGEEYWEVTSPSPWNYGIVLFDFDRTAENFEVTIDQEKLKAGYPWNYRNAPVSIKVKARRLNDWRLYNEMTGPLPYSVSTSTNPTETITLIPYGCTTLRVSEFPLVWPSE